MSSLQEAALDQIISTCPDDILLNCYRRIVEKLKQKTATIIVGIDPTIGGFINKDLDELDMYNSMLLATRFIGHFCTKIKSIIYSEDDIQDYLINAEYAIKINPKEKYTDFLINYFEHSIDISNTCLAYSYYKVYIIKMISNYFKQVYNMEDSNYLTNLLNEFINNNEIPEGLDFTKIFRYQAFNMFDKIMPVYYYHSNKILNITSDDAPDIDEHIKVNVYTII